MHCVNRPWPPGADCCGRYQSLFAGCWLNMASFLTTWMEDDAIQVLNKALAINMADAVQYPSAATMEKRCVRMLAKLGTAPTTTSLAQVKGTGFGPSITGGGSSGGGQRQH